MLRFPKREMFFLEMDSIRTDHMRIDLATCSTGLELCGSVWMRMDACKRRQIV